MSFVGKLKEIAKTECTRTFEWRIDDFFSLSEEDRKCYYSPPFLIDGELCCLYIYPNRSSRNNSVGYIGVYFHRESSGPSKSMIRTFSIKTVDGKKYCEKQDSTVLSKVFGRGFPEFLKRSELIEKKSTLVPDGVLTIVCKTESCSKSTTYDADNPAKVKCSDCKEEFDAESLPSHKQKCLNKPIRCPTCSDVVELRNWFDHECPQLRAEEPTEDIAKQESQSSPSSTKSSEDTVQHPLANSGNKNFCTYKEMFFKYCDVIIKVKEQEFQAHRGILSARSTVLASIFRNDPKDRTTETIDIEDCDPATFSEFLCFIYSGNVENLSTGNVFDLFTLADKYKVEEFRATCLEFIKNNLSVDIFCDSVALAVQHSEKELVRLAADFFTKHFEEITVTEKLKSLLIKNPIADKELMIKALVLNK